MPLEIEKLKEELLTKKGIRTWKLGKIRGISWLQKELKLGNSLSGKCVQEWKPRVRVAGQPFANTSEISKAQSIKSHRGSLKRLGVWLIHPLHLLSRSQNKKCDHPGKTCGGASCLSEFLWYILETHRFLGMLYQQKYWDLGLKMTEKDKWEKTAKLQNSTGRKQAHKTTHLQNILLFLQKEVC